MRPTTKPRGRAPSRRRAPSSLSPRGKGKTTLFLMTMMAFYGSVVREDESEAGENDDEAGAEGVSIAMGTTLVIPEGFGCISDSYAIKEIIARLHHDYGIPSDVILSLSVKGYDAYNPSKGTLLI
ncbi:hypothetical protein QYF36_015723 [Acer negundo]|nr:hypothetical protein QYF36_015723 [Acer negundo]